MQVSCDCTRPPTDVQVVGGNTAQTPGSKQQARSELPQAELVIELGRYFVGEAGVYVTRVVDRKVSRGQVYLVTDGGLNHHLSASGNFGQVVRKNYPAAIGNRMQISLNLALGSALATIGLTIPAVAFADGPVRCRARYRQHRTTCRRSGRCLRA